MMERGGWLWRRESSEKNPCETESSGSISSPSERYSDDQACPSINIQSPEASSSNEDAVAEAKTLSAKLSAALVSIREKEALAKQHAKVAEEAVSGWEKAENEVASLKQQLESATQRNAALEGRVLHLDGALKECVKQTMQAREEQDDTISTLRDELHSHRERLQRVTIERDLSVEAAESASKQRLESIKKSARLEGECRRLKTMHRRAYDQASSTYMDSLTDAQSDCDSEKIASSSPLTRNLVTDMDLMDDFVEMERLVESTPELDVPTLTRRVAELEGVLDGVERRKVRVEGELRECHRQLGLSQDCVRGMEVKLLDLQNELARSVDVGGKMEEARAVSESRLRECRNEKQSLERTVRNLEDEMEREKASSEEAWRKCRELEGELSKLKLDIAAGDVSIKAKQEEGLAIAAGKLEDCQNTIAALGRKIQSLATLDDFSVDTWHLKEYDIQNVHLGNLHSGEFMVSPSR